MTTSRIVLLGGAAMLVGGAASAQELNLICSADVVICERLVQEFEASHERGRGAQSRARSPRPWDASRRRPCVSPRAEG